MRNTAWRPGICRESPNPRPSVARRAFLYLPVHRHFSAAFRRCKPGRPAAFDRHDRSACRAQCSQDTLITIFRFRRIGHVCAAKRSPFRTDTGRSRAMPSASCPSSVNRSRPVLPSRTNRTSFRRIQRRIRSPVHRPRELCAYCTLSYQLFSRFDLY